MIIPIRCFSCGKPMGHHWEQYQSADDKKKAMDDMGVDRYCCRALLMGHVDLVDTIAEFKRAQSAIFFLIFVNLYKPILRYVT